MPRQNSKPGIGELIQRGLQLGRGTLRHRLDQLIGELAAEHRADLRDLLGAPARAGRAAPSARHASVAGTDSAASEVVASTAATRSPCSALSSTALVSSSTNSGTPSVRSTISATISRASAALPASVRTSAAPSRSPSRLSAKLVTWGWPPQGGWNSGRKVIDQQHRQPPHPVDGQIEQLARGRVDPVGVLEHHQHRPAPRHGFELAAAAPRTASRVCAAG